METNGTTMTNGTSEARTSGRCPANGTVKPLTPKELTTRKTTCPECNKSLVIKDNHFTEDFTGMTIPNHNRVIEMPTLPAMLPAPSPPAPSPQSATADNEPARPGDTVMHSPDGEIMVLDRAPLPPSITPAIPITSAEKSGLRDVTITITVPVMECLERLVVTGLFGLTVADAVDQLLREKIRDLRREAWINL